MVSGSVCDGMMPTIPQFFQGKSIFVTGGTGFMGKVLLSKLLLSLEGIDKIYVLIRSNKGKCANSRLKEMLKLPLFEPVPPSHTEKLVAVEGDIMKLRLGLSDADYATLSQKVSIVFHVAATVRFNELLHKAILINTRATREVINLCLEMKQLTALLHVSTTYCNCDLNPVEEKVYSTSVDWQDALSMVENLSPNVINALSDKYIGKKPNTYTFTKSLAEQVVWEHRHLLPVIIFRPSIVVSSWKEPFPGWMDNFNGPLAMMIGAGYGILRVIMMDSNIVSDFMPVDVAIRAVIVAAYVKSVLGLQIVPDEFVVNCASTITSIPLKDVLEIGIELLEEMPLTNALWMPTSDTTTNLTYYTIKSWFAHLLPAMVIDSVLKLFGKKPKLVNLQVKIYAAVTAISHFSCNEWEFKNEKFLRLLKYILPEDKEDFDFDFRDIDARLYYRNSLIGARKYLLHDPIENVPKGKMRSKRLYWINKIILASLVVVIALVLDLPNQLQFLWHSAPLDNNL